MLRRLGSQGYSPQAIANGPSVVHWPEPPPSASRMVESLAQSTGRTSLYPLGAFFLASAGKLVLAVGAGLAVNGALDHDDTTLHTGIALVAVGFAAALSAAVMFAADVKPINYRLGWTLKCCSVSAAGLIGAGYGLRGYGAAAQNLALERAAAALLAAGVATMCVTLPWFVSHSEARRGLMPLGPFREPVRVGGMALGAGALFGWAVCASGPQYPAAASQTVLTAATMLLTLGVALSTSDILQQKAFGAVAHQGLRAAQQAGAWPQRRGALVEALPPEA